ncbi:MAG: hypothetical protein K8T26_14065 [Lentisphaerae bacterium]|nr:hypothetical protein [Lentisphaerota bacterium]
MKAAGRTFNQAYTGDNLQRVAFPMGGIGSGMLCLEGTGALSHLSLRHKPEVYNEPTAMAAISIKGKNPVARVLEGPVPMWKAFGPGGSGNGSAGKTHGLPRFAEASFLDRFPFGTVTLRDDDVPLAVDVTGWSPFVPGDADSASLPVAALEYRFRNTTRLPVAATFSFHAANFMKAGKGTHGVGAVPGGFCLRQDGTREEPHTRGAFAAFVTDPDVRVNCAWFRSGWWDSFTLAWKSVVDGVAIAQPPIVAGEPSRGGSVALPFELRPGEEKTVRLLLAWYVPVSDVRVGSETEVPPGPDGRKPSYRPWYAARFDSLDAVAAYWAESYDDLRAKSARFRDAFYDTTLAPEVVEAAAANLTILKSPTVMRQADGRFWAWEGCCDGCGCCHGSCTHVWNYAQAVPHLFPDLERSLRQTEFNECQDKRGHQRFRAPLPIGPADHKGHHAAADGQLGGILKVYREWRISGDLKWLRTIWPKVRQSLNYCIATWDPKHKGLLEEPHHNTYDIEFWGPDGMCGSFYLGALKAASAMATALGKQEPLYDQLYARGRKALESQLYNGEYFIQDIRWKDLKAKDPSKDPKHYSPEAVELLHKEGPKYQYGKGCLADGVLGAWMAHVCGLGDILEPRKVRSHLRAVHQHNLKTDLSRHANPQRPAYAIGKEGGLLLCTWPRGGRLSLPFVYSDEVWTGIEYQVAAHLMLEGCVREGLEIVRTARLRYDGRVRNPFNEYECGHWYGRAMASYSLLQGLSGARYDAVDKTLYLAPHIKGDFRAFLATATGYGTVGVRRGKPFVDVREGTIDVKAIRFTPCKAKA